jgi:hypothetical protein
MKTTISEEYQLKFIQIKQMNAVNIGN